MAIEKMIFPIKKTVDLSIVLNVYQRVYHDIPCKCSQIFTPENLMGPNGELAHFWEPL